MHLQYTSKSHPRYHRSQQCLTICRAYRTIKHSHWQRDLSLIFGCLDYAKLASTHPDDHALAQVSKKPGAYFELQLLLLLCEVCTASENEVEHWTEYTPGGVRHDDQIDYYQEENFDVKVPWEKLGDFGAPNPLERVILPEASDRWIAFVQSVAAQDADDKTG